MITTAEEYQTKKNELINIENKLNNIAKSDDVNLKEVIDLRNKALDRVKSLNAFINSITKQENS